MTKGKGNHDKEQYIINVMGIKLTGEALIIEKQILTNNNAKNNTFCIQTKLVNYFWHNYFYLILIFHFQLLKNYMAQWCKMEAT